MIPKKSLILNANNLAGGALDFEAANIDKKARIFKILAVVQKFSRSNNK